MVMPTRPYKPFNPSNKKIETNLSHASASDARRSERANLMWLARTLGSLSDIMNNRCPYKRCRSVGWPQMRLTPGNKRVGFYPSGER